MAVLENGDNNLMQLWSLITELSEQLNQNRSVSVSLYAQAGNIKVRPLVIYDCNACSNTSWFSP
jgi:hypothetical protein